MVRRQVFIIYFSLPFKLFGMFHDYLLKPVLKTVCEYAVLFIKLFWYVYAYKNNTSVLAITSPRDTQLFIVATTKAVILQVI